MDFSKLNLVRPLSLDAAQEFFEEHDLLQIINNTDYSITENAALCKDTIRFLSLFIERRYNAEKSYFIKVIVVCPFII